MEIESYLPFLIQLLLVLGFGISLLVISQWVGQRARKTAITDTPYECGMVAEGKAHSRFAVKFYMTAMLFILFDIELIFMSPWAMVYRDFLAAQIPILLPMLFFLLVLVVGLIYEVEKGALKWKD